MLEKVKSLPVVRNLFKGKVDYNREYPLVEMGGSLDAYFQNLMSLSSDAVYKALSPETTHPWIFASANMTALVASQAPFKIFKETEEVIKKRRLKANELQQVYRPGVGNKRKALRKYSNIPTSKRLLVKNLEEDYDHPISDLLENPNKYQSKSHFFYSLIALVASEGSCLVVKLNESGQLVSSDTEVPSEIWPIPERHFDPIFILNEKEDQIMARVGWKFTPPKWFPLYKKEGVGNWIFVPEYAVADFVKPDPRNPTGGMSPMTPLAGSLVTDYLIDEINRRLLANGAVPSGIITSKGAGLTPDQRKDIREEWMNRHAGSHNAGSLLVLNNAEFKTLGLTPNEMASKDMLSWNREKELAVTNTPPSVLGITEFTNYATQLGQDRNFWDKNLIPLLHMLEASFDKHFLKKYSDETVGLFDLSGVEALRIGLINQIRGAERLCGQALHLPPYLAFSLMGVTIDRYDGDDINIALEAHKREERDRKEELDDSDKKPPVGTMEDPEENNEENPTPEKEEEISDKKLVKTPTVTKEAARAIFDLTYGAMVPRVASAYAKWVQTLQEDILSSELLTLRNVGISIDIQNILPGFNELQQSLRNTFQPLYTEFVARVSSTMAAEAGIPIFEINLERMSEFVAQHQKRLLSKIIEGTQKRVLKELTDALNESNSLLEFREKIKEVLKVESDRARKISRTFSATLIQGLQYNEYLAQGFKRFIWDDSKDDVVRDDHVTFGKAGPKPAGFNYLDLTNDVSGVLEYPGDLRAPLKQISECRCVLLPVE